MPPTVEPSQPTATPKKGMGERVWDVLLDLIPEGITTIGLLAIVALSHWLIELWMGKGAKFFDYVPVEWVFDAGHVTVIVRFLWMSIKKFK
jgi:hypothetical protein